MTSESLRSQVEKRIAELLRQAGNRPMDESYELYRRPVVELEQVLTLIDKMAKELEGYSCRYPDYSLIKAHALTLLVGNKDGESR